MFRLWPMTKNFDASEIAYKLRIAASLAKKKKLSVTPSKRKVFFNISDLCLEKMIVSLQMKVTCGM